MTKKIRSATSQDEPEFGAKLLRIPLSQICVNINTTAGRLQSELHYLSQNSPTLREVALPYLQLIQPILVSRSEEGGRSDSAPSFRLIAGFRTFQLCCELYNRQKKCRVICLDGLSEQQVESMQALDSVCIKVLQHPNDIDIGWIALALKSDKSFRKQLDDLLPVSTDEQLSRLLGIGRTTLHEKIQSAQLWMDQMQKTEVKPAVVRINLEDTSTGAAE